MDEGLSRSEKMAFDPSGCILDFGFPTRELNRIIDTGEPFRTSGCEGYDGQVACNRPYANSRPGPNKGIVFEGPGGWRHKYRLNRRR